MDQKTTGGFSGMLRATLDFIRQMLLAPAAQLRDMEKSGGFTEPVLLIVRLGLLAGVVRIFVTFYHMANGASVGLLRALSAVLFVPVSLLAISYIASFLLWLVMRLLGRDSDLETAFRVVAHLCALAPVAVLALAIPYLGNFETLLKETDHGQGQVRAYEAARERGDDRARGPREDDVDGGDHEGAVEQGVVFVRVVRPGGEGVGVAGAAGRHEDPDDRDGARGVRDGEPALRARGLSGAHGLREEHDHGRGADGR
ncbi:MAG: YIP1 family protein, partial [Chloroflexia bacterium]|nr:YIP1 family protein [Chloroflexia bacterium]